MGTAFTEVYNCFLTKITDDMYMELTPEDTVKDLQFLLINSIPEFEFPRVNLYDYSIQTEIVDQSQVTEKDFPIRYIWNSSNNSEPPKILLERSKFNVTLSQEEIDIVALMMLEGWLQRQIASVENTRMKYSGSDFKFTSQANHLAKLLELLSETQRKAFHMQRLYKRRKIGKDGKYESNWSVLRS